MWQQLMLLMSRAAVYALLYHGSTVCLLHCAGQKCFSECNESNDMDTLNRAALSSANNEDVPYCTCRTNGLSYARLIAGLQFENVLENICGVCLLCKKAWVDRALGFLLWCLHDVPTTISIRTLMVHRFPPVQSLHTIREVHQETAVEG